MVSFKFILVILVASFFLSFEGAFLVLSTLSLHLVLIVGNCYKRVNAFPANQIYL